MQYLPYIIGLIAIILGLKTIITRQATLNIRLWGNPNRQDSSGFTTSEHTGFMAILIGIGEIATGIAILAKGPHYFS